MDVIRKIAFVRAISGLSPIEKLILLTISTHLGHNEFTFLSLTTLQRECCIAKRHTLIKYLSKLEEKHLLKKIAPSDGFKSNRYGLNFDLIIKLTEKLSTECSKYNNYLVPHRDYPSPCEGLPQSLTGTRLVPHRDPKRNINKIKQKYKQGTHTKRARDLNNPIQEQNQKRQPVNQPPAQFHPTPVVNPITNPNATPEPDRLTEGQKEIGKSRIAEIMKNLHGGMRA